MTTIIIILIFDVALALALALALIRTLSAKKAMEGYCETAKQSSLIAKSMLDNARDLHRQAEAMLAEARKKMEEFNDERRTYNLPKM